ncbi:hypothetical protein ACFL6U_29885 [Planctomycetota bacterium]
MKSPISKLAIAAVIVLCVVLGVIPNGPRVSFADVIEPLLNFRTIALDFIVGDEESAPVIHDIIKGNRIRRTISNVDNIMIIDLDSAQMMVLTPDTKTAGIFDIQGTVNEGTQKLLEMVRTIVSKVQNDPDKVKKLGKRDLNGIETIGFRITNPKVSIDLWADLETATPKRIELTMGQGMSILKNIEFDVPVPDHLISMDPPEGYTLGKETIAMGEATEEDLIVTLGFWAEHINQGVFPDSLGVQELLSLQPELVKTFGTMGGSEEDLTQIGMHYGRSILFLTLLSQQGQWHYAGKGVAWDDADTAVFWYRCGDAKTYRVIYGDLHVEDVALDNLPQ